MRTLQEKRFTMRACILFCGVSYPTAPALILPKYQQITFEIHGSPQHLKPTLLIIPFTSTKFGMRYKFPTQGSPMDTLADLVACNSHGLVVYPSRFAHAFLNSSVFIVSHMASRIRSNSLLFRFLSTSKTQDTFNILRIQNNRKTFHGIVI